MAMSENPRDGGKAKAPATPVKAPASPGAAIEQGKVDITKEDLDKVSGGHTPSRAIVIEY